MKPFIVLAGSTWEKSWKLREMNFRNARARQPEIVRSIQKDANYTNELSSDFSDLLRLTGVRNWIKYNQMCKVIADITYHGFGSINSLQTLGEEYTGIIQVDAEYRNIPSKLLQLIALILEFGGDALFFKVLQKTREYISHRNDMTPEAKHILLTVISVMRDSQGFMKALHKSYFYLRSDKYQISKRVTGINYVLIRHWLQPDFSLHGYKILGIITFLQVIVSAVMSALETLKEHQSKFMANAKESDEGFLLQHLSTDSSFHASASQCILCMGMRTNTSLSPCGHLFCWNCLLNWLEERNDCPLCRELIKKPSVVQLINF